MYYGSTGLENLTMNELRERIASVSLELKDLELDPHKNSLKIAQVKIRKSNLVAEMMKRQGAVVVQGQATSKGKASEQPIQMVKTQPQPSASTVQPIAQDKPALLPFEPTMDTTFVGRGPSMLTTTAPAGYDSDLNTKKKTQIAGTLAVAGLIGYSIGKKYNQPMIGALIGAYIPTLVAGNFARPNISLTRGITEFTQTLSK
jgi:hypothetical protein